MQVNTNQYVPDSAFTKGSFLEFLEYVYSPLHGYVLGVVQLVAGDTYVSISPTDFDAKLATEVFPTPTGQQLLVKALNDDMGEEIAGAWFPAAKVNPLLKLISTGGKKVKDVVDFIAKPGVASHESPAAALSVLLLSGFCGRTYAQDLQGVTVFTAKQFPSLVPLAVVHIPLVPVYGTNTAAWPLLT